MEEEKLIYVVVAEDDDSHAEAVKRALGQSGIKYRIRRITTWSEYQILVKEEEPDVVLLDLRLSDVWIFENFPEVDFKSFPVIVMTSCTDVQMANKVFKYGAVEYLIKSLDTFNQISIIVQQTLEKWNKLKDEKIRTKAELKEYHLMVNTLMECRDKIEALTSKN